MTTVTGHLTPSASIQDISDRAMLVGLTIRQFNPVKTDKVITKEVADKHGSEVSMGRYAKSVIAKSACDTLRKLGAEIRTEHYRRTLPWSEDGARILTSAGYTAYAEWMRDSESRWSRAVSEFLSDWDSFVADARIALNGLFRQSDYPSATELANKFEFRWTVRPVPVADDFRVTMSSNEVAAIRQDISTSLQSTVQDAMKDVWSRMRDVVSAMASRLRAYDPNNPGVAPFRDSLVSNIADLLAILPTLNLTANPELDRFMSEMRALTQADAQTLRDNMYTREDTAKRAESILNQMSQFFA